MNELYATAQYTLWKEPSFRSTMKDGITRVEIEVRSLQPMTNLVRKQLVSVKFDSWCRTIFKSPQCGALLFLGLNDPAPCSQQA